MEEFSEKEKRALRGSKFAPLPSLPPPSQPRMAHPGGSIKTNKAAALAKFLERKLQDPQGLASINPDLVELAVRKAKDSVTSGDASSSARTFRHVDSFDDPQDSFDDQTDEDADLKNHENVKKENGKDNKRNKKKKRKTDQMKMNKKNKKRKVDWEARHRSLAPFSRWIRSTEDPQSMQNRATAGEGAVEADVEASSETEARENSRCCR